MERDSADQLDVIMALAKCPDRRLAHRGERLGQQIVELLTIGEPLTEQLGLAAQLVIGKRLDRRLEDIDGVDIFAKAADIAVVGRSEDAFCHCGEHGIPLKTRAFKKGRSAPATLGKLRPAM